MSVPLDRAALESVPWKRLHRARSWSQATIWGVEWEGQRVAIKDFAQRGWLARMIVGRWAVAREARVYRRLEGADGVPRVFGVIAGPALVMEWLPVKRLPKRQDHNLTPAFFDALDALLATIHARGVAHGDIRRKNIAIGDDGLPRLIDFTTAITCPAHGWGLTTPLQRYQAKIDRLTALRIRLSFFEGTVLTPEQRAMFTHEPRSHRLGRWVRQRLYRPFKKKILRR